MAIADVTAAVATEDVAEQEVVRATVNAKRAVATEVVAASVDAAKVAMVEVVAERLETTGTSAVPVTTIARSQRNFVRVGRTARHGSTPCPKSRRSSPTR
jgi:hypothetical protein